MDSGTRHLLILCLCLGVSGCTAYQITDDRLEVPVSAHEISCEEPYELVRDCTRMGADQHVSLGGEEFEIASNQSGDVLYFTQTPNGTVGSLMLDVVTLNTADPAGYDLERCFETIESTLSAAGVEIERIVPVIIPQFIVKTGSLGDTYGYILELDGDGRSVLDQYAISENGGEVPNQH